MVKQKRMETGETEQSEWISNKFEHKELKAEDRDMHQKFAKKTKTSKYFLGLMIQ